MYTWKVVGESCKEILWRVIFCLSRDVFVQNRRPSVIVDKVRYWGMCVRKVVGESCKEILWRVISVCLKMYLYRIYEVWKSVTYGEIGYIWGNSGKLPLGDRVSGYFLSCVRKKKREYAHFGARAPKYPPEADASYSL